MKMEFVSRLSQRFIALIMLLLLTPFLFPLVIFLFIDDGLPILFRQVRVGKDNHLFKIYKFRTMKKNTPDIATHLLSNPENVYTATGPLLRKLSIDELPQLLNIIKGEMVFIGPRPALHNQDDLIEQRTALGIHKLWPGVTGWAQINGRDEVSIEEKVRLDHHYLQNRSFALDMYILFRTILKSATAEDVSH